MTVSASDVGTAATALEVKVLGPHCEPISDVELDVTNALLDALETACLAGGSRRVVLSPPRPSLAMLERRGYRTVKASCAGCWIEKMVG
jgi:hypothetical protein